MEAVETKANDTRRPGETLRAAGVSRSFQGVQALADVDLELHDREVVGLIGPNGAGKSTFFNCLAGDLVPTAGKVVFDGVDVTRAAPEAHARLGIGRTFQVPATFADMTVLENVMVGAFLRHPQRGEAQDAALRVIEMTGLRELAGQPARNLGTPNRKRLEIARVMATYFRFHSCPTCQGVLAIGWGTVALSGSRRNTRFASSHFAR